MANVLKGTVLAEVDFSAIEAVLVGWFARSPQYITLAKLGVHSRAEAVALAYRLQLVLVPA